MPIEFVATSRLPTAFGEFNITVFQDPKTGEEHVALSKGLDQPIIEPVLVRVHSECLTGDAFASLKCDCGPQLQATQKLINVVRLIKYIIAGPTYIRTRLTSSVMRFIKSPVLLIL